MNILDGIDEYQDLLEVDIAKEHLERIHDDVEATPEKAIIDKAISLANSTSPTIIIVCECLSLCPSFNLVHPNPESGQGEADSQAIAATSVNFADIEKISPLCKLKLFEDGGLNVEYRCVKCRDYPDCKNSDESEKISL